jgi:hypothetical protein
MSNFLKSNKGMPTTNQAYVHNARLDQTYSPYVFTTSGTWQQHHPDAITVYNDTGVNISSYVNTGVSDWTNTYHAIWTYDSVLGRPVVTMRNIDGAWKAKAWGLDTLTNMGLPAGSTYTVSWLQWVDNITGSANVGLYGLDTSGSPNFWDGLSNGQSTSYNTAVNTWQRVYATFTVNSVRSQSGWSNLYMYGMYMPVGSTVKIADVQFEIGSIPSGFSKVPVRTSTQAINDLANNVTLTVNNLTYAADGSFAFNGTSSLINGTSSNINRTTGDSITVSCWVKPTRLGGQYQDLVANRNTSTHNWILYQHATDGSIQLHGANQNKSSYIPAIGTWVYITATVDGAGNSLLYANGVLQQTVTGYAYNGTGPGTLVIGANNTVNEFFLGSIGAASIYNRAMTASEIMQSFNAHRGRYGV